MSDNNKTTKTFKEALEGIGVYIVDVETTGLHKKDKLFSSAWVGSEEGFDNVSSRGRFSHDIGVFASKKSGLKDGAYSKEKHISATEANLAKSHSSKKFGKDQKNRGSLRRVAEDIVDGHTVKPEELLKNLEAQIESDSKKGFGSVFFGHNLNFENSVFNKEMLKGSPEYKDIHSSLVARNISNSSNLFSVPETLSNNSRAKDIKGAVQKANIYYSDYVLGSLKRNDPEAIRQSIKGYADAQREVLREAIEAVQKARTSPGSFVALDSLHLQRAVMAIGAERGDVDVGNLKLGGSVDVMAQAWGFGSEKHTAEDDVELQRKITKILTEEADKLQKDPNYSSEKLKTLNKFINENDVATTTFKKNLVNQFSMKVFSLDNTEQMAKFSVYANDLLDSFSVASGNHEQRVEFLEQFQKEKNRLISQNKYSIETIKSRLEVFSGPVEKESPAPLNKSSKSFDILSHIEKNKTPYIVGAGVLVGSMFLGKGDKEISYNTYDEVYNNLYYGSPFADWQERNNAHKILY